ncbi:PAS domain S-box protein [Azospirillum canadense]|uniref:PAS domain S-box protein n=1 Tax=Azospirillum canadense TaxID=403962 RepID=UPI0022279756|nr:PAS domain S-box protein [Azospirillum canadense]MCW2239638.1 PAS domain S-box-containing protein [Azospirillum canadense]
MSLLHRLTLLVLLVLLPTVGIEVWNQVELRHAREADVHQQAARTLALVEAEHVRLVEGIRQIMLTLRQTRPVRDHDFSTCQSLLDRLRSDYPEYLDVYVIDQAGVVRCATDTRSLGISGADRPHVRRALETQDFVVGEYVVRRSDQKPVLPFALPYHGADDRPAGVLVGALDIRWLEQYLAHAPLPPNTSVTMIDRSGIVVARAPERPGVVGHGAPESYRPLLEAHEPGTADMLGLDGVPRIMAYSPFTTGQKGLLITVGIDRAVAFQGIDDAMVRSLALAAVVLALSLLAAWWGGRHYLHRPIAALMDVTRRWRNGDQGARAGLRGRSEIAGLGQAFDAMADDVERHAREREHALAETRQAEARLRAIVDTAVDAMVVIDEAGIIQSFNPAAQHIFGYAPEDAVGNNMKMLMPEPDRTRHDGYIGNYQRTGERKIIGIGRQVVGRRKDGSTFPLELAIAEWRVDGQRFFTGIMRDVTERHEAEHRLQRSNTLLETIIEGIPDPVFVKDREGRFLVVNEGTCRLFDNDRSQLLGARDRDFSPLDVAARIEAMDQHTMQTGEVTVLEEEVFDLKRQERRFYLSTKAPLCDAAGTVIGLVGIGRDITERKFAEDDLRAAKSEAERANVAKSKFLAAASHDLRQPVQSLVLFLGVLKERLAGTPSADMLVAMEQALDGLRMLLNGLLDVSRLDAGLVVANPLAMPVSPLLSRLAAEYEPRANGKGLSFRIVDSDAVVHSDPILLERMLRNLVENAVRYTERGGVLVGARRRGDRLRIEVVDTGIGIAPERQDEVFEEFFQVGNPERDRGKGLGLGLAVVRRLARLLGHDIKVHSILRSGSTFTIEVPVASPTPLAVATEPSASAAAGGLVLVVDDEELVRFGLQAMVEGWGYRVLAAGSLAEALQVLGGGEPPDVLLADYRLRAAETGLDVIRAVHGHLGARIPAAIVTGDTAPERLAEIASHRVVSEA